jgi:hypothetical protein
MSREKTPLCRNECGQRVWFNWSAKAGEPGRSDFGKLRPLQVSEEGECLNETHDCPNSDYNRKQQSRQVPTSSTSTTTTYSGMEAVLGNTLDIIARIEKIDHQLALISRLLFQLSNKLNANPLDDDGDSNRENPEPEP